MEIEEEKRKRILGNLDYLSSQNAPQGDVQKYMRTQGVTISDLEGRPNSELRAPESFLKKAGRGLLEGVPMAARAAGGFAGGALGAAGGPGTAIGGAVLGAAGAGQLADIAVDYLKGNKPQTGMQRVGTAATDIAADLGFQMIPYGGGSVLRAFRKGLAAPNAAQTMEDLARAGITTKAAMPEVGGRSVQIVSKIQERGLVSGDVWNKAITETQEDFARSFERSRGRFGTATEKTTGGEAVIAGIDTYAKRTSIVADRLYSRVRNLDRLPVDMQETKAVASELLERIEKGLGDSATEKMLSDIVSRADTISFKDARLIRSDLLSIARQQDSLLADKAQSAGKLLAKTLERNMDGSARLLDPQQFSKWERANAFYKQRAKALEAVDGIWKSDSGQQAFNAAVSGAADGPAKLLALKKVLPADQWDEFRAVMLHQMGLESKGVATETQRRFSPTSFLSNYANMSAKSKEVLFGNQTELRNELDRLVRLGGQIRSAGHFAENTSRSASQLIAGGQVGSVMTGTGLVGHGLATGNWWEAAGGAAAILLPTAGSYGTARLMTAPWFVKWVADGASLLPRNPNALSQHMARLVKLTTGHPEFKEDVEEYLETKRVKK